MENPKYKVPVISLEKPMKINKDKLEELKGAVKGAALNRMKKEAVDCPVYQRQIVFVECFLCRNFMRRVRGEVDCKGLPFT